MAHRFVLDLDSLAWNQDAREFEQQKVKTGAPFGQGAAHVDLGWLGEVAVVGSDAERFEALGELLMVAARDLRFVQVAAQEAAVTLQPMADPYEGAA